jgi:hypothetical protein
MLALTGIDADRGLMLPANLSTPDTRGFSARLGMHTVTCLTPT